MTGRPSGMVTFLFTDIEGSTRLWESDPDAMRLALAAHDDVLHAAVAAAGGWLFKHTGDGVCAAFGSAQAAIDAAVAAQLSLGMPVRMGINTGEPEQRGEDYFGPPLNRAARVMAVGHGGQIVVSSSTGVLVSGNDLVDLGHHRLRDLSGAEQLFQVRADGLRVKFPPLRTVDAVHGNLPEQLTSFVGREVEVKELAELVRSHRLVTLTGVGGVGKTRLAVQVAAEMVPDFPDGVWLVELAPVGDPAAVPDAVATALGIKPQPGRTIAGGIAEALIGRRLLIVFDNCEHVLDAAAGLVEEILARTSKVTVIATSREGLRVGAEHLWPVPSLGVHDGAGTAVELFFERAHALVPEFNLDADADAVAVTEICRRLDGIALAIELAAARMVSMTPTEVLARLNDRFRLLSGPLRGLERHQTLRQAVQWSYDLLTADEKTVLAAAAVFSGGFDLASIAAVCDRFDEYTMLDLVDSLVRKSLMTATRAAGGTRYGMLETIRQFTEDQHATNGGLAELRDRHAHHFADGSVANWDLWDGPDQLDVTEWVDAQFDNLRAGFRWATGRSDLITASEIAAHSAIFAHNLQRYEPVSWAEELLPAAVAADLAALPRLYLAASYCLFTGRAEDAVGYARAVAALQDAPGYQPVIDGWARYMEALACLDAFGYEGFLEICTELAAENGLSRLLGLCGLTSALSSVGRPSEAIAIAGETIEAALAYGNPFWIAHAYYAYGTVFTDTDPERARDSFRQGLTYARQHRLPFWESYISSEAAGLEASLGDVETAADMFAWSINSFHQAGDTSNLAVTFANMVLFLDLFGRPEIAATLYGAAKHHVIEDRWPEFDAALDHLREVLGTDTFDDHVRLGAAMDTTEAVHYAQHHIELARDRTT